MEYIADLHTHSKYAMACSEQLNLENMDAAAREKGITIMSTGDFTHPRWLNEIKSNLSQSQGILTLKGSPRSTKFILGSEVCTIFEDKGGKSRKIHHGIFVPDIDSAELVNEQLSKHGNLESDGRPALMMSPAQLVEAVKGVSRDSFVFPAHAWTPWFGILGAFSGFDSIEEGYEDQAKYIHALETGLSSDPAMNWRISKLDKYALISGSDAHSLPKLGREAVVFEFEKEPSYKQIIDSIKEKRMKMTIEFYPEEGKYHFDGHRNCNISLSPEESSRYGDRCPRCGKRLTIGVLHRVDKLADREEGYKPSNAVPFVHAIPLEEVIAYVMKKNTYSPFVKSSYKKLIEKFSTEFNVLIKADIDQIKEADKDLGKAIGSVREGRVNLVPGYDGIFGIIDIF
ncbi:MAG: DNA helicase UvrD, partial [Candidatus Micrarchaeota archaeon]|nr:DNA helicase UvrD [Candidatus Micrarchaeota archaeon]